MLTKHWKEKQPKFKGLKINKQKTKYMIAARNDGTIRFVGRETLEVVKELVYLRSLMTPTKRESANTKYKYLQELL
jgi:hypothetical protein